MSFVVAVDDQGVSTVQRTTPAGTNMEPVGQCLAANFARLHFPAGEPKTFAVALTFIPN